MAQVIKSISVKNFLGIKENKEVLTLSENGRFTILSGANNSGKSIISRCFQIFNEGSSSNSSAIDVQFFNEEFFYQYNIGENAIIEMELTVNQQTKEILKMNSWHESLKDARIFLTTEIYGFDRMSGLKVCYIIKIKKEEQSYQSRIIDKDVIYAAPSINENKDFIQATNLQSNKIGDITNELFDYIKNKLLVFDAQRFLDNNNRLFSTGKDLVPWLAKINKESASKKKLFYDSIQVLFKRLSLPHIVSIDPYPESSSLKFNFEYNFTLNHNMVGTGTLMVFIILAECIRQKKQLIVIDEIESHLHPSLVRELMGILRDEMKADFIICTHSPTVIQTLKRDDVLYRFYKYEQECNFEKVTKKIEFDYSDIRNDLGVLPTDAFVSNCVIWVEGPTDILWVRAWLRVYFKKAKIVGLIEGLHYSFMMTGGSLISHFDFSDDDFLYNEETDKIIRVMSITPNPFVIIDSDDVKAGTKKYQRIIRIARELNKSDTISELNDISSVDNMCILGAKEIENYAPPEILKEFYTALEDKRGTKVLGCGNVNDWDVYSKEKSVGAILESRGVKNITKNGFLKHKTLLAEYIFANFSDSHLNIEDSIAVTEITNYLQKIVLFIKKRNHMK